jgi:hypothetical protein
LIGLVFARSAQTSDIRHQTSDIRHQTSDIRHQTSDIRHQTSDIRHQTSDIRQNNKNVFLVDNVFVCLRRSLLADFNLPRSPTLALKNRAGAMSLCPLKARRESYFKIHFPN